MTDISFSEEIYTVSRLNRDVRMLLESGFPTLWIEGEISNFVAPRSGHWYFSLKDSLAQVRCAMFRRENGRLNFTPADGMHVLAKVRVSLYEGRGDFQLLIEQIEEIGAGQLQRAFEALKKRLAAAGLFDQKHKKSLPELPESIGVITSPTGAAIRDILSVLKRRFPYARVIIYPTLVQGETAAPTIVEAIQTANRRKECDVLLLARGGGSLEDLWPFNEEKVAHAIYKSRIPIVSGVGHEIDFTIADFVADLRAPTPSVAAESVTPDVKDVFIQLKQQKQQLIRCMQNQLREIKQHLMWATKHLKQQHPRQRLQAEKRQLDFHFQRFCMAIENKLQQKKQQLKSYIAQLEALSPLGTLQRGYAIASKLPLGQIIRDAKKMKPNDKLSLRLQKGRLLCTVDEVQDA
ncbi:MAG: exodeoxyribonuclease VII large subunit [Gammaproteobacteria bacterium]|nr:exodeoxyribonuclease VII large subunit [Gammaproteobacteria bacterium]